MTNLEQVTEGLDDLICEFQIDSFGLIEKGYKVVDRKDPRVLQLINFLAINAPEFNNHSYYPFEAISFHPADGLTYLNETAVVVYKAPPGQDIIDQYDIPNGNFMPGFAIKYDLVTGQSIVKMGDLDTTNYAQPKLPWFTQIGYEFGVGVYFSREDHPALEITDHYVANPFRPLMKWKFGILYPDYKEDFKPVIRAYGITSRYGEVIKLKRYIYWNDKELKHLDRA